MRPGSLRQAQWHAHVTAVHAPPSMRHWLAAGGSLTAKLKAHSRAFRVQCLHQETARCLTDEAAIIGLHRAGRVWERDVLLRCDNRPAVYGHTVVPMQATATDWPLFSGLGERSLGTTLFGDRMVRRSGLEFARLRAGHPLVRRAQAALALEGRAAPEQALFFARRCLYRRHQGLLLVTEVFLPAVLELAPVVATDTLINKA
ncbi:chorismate lyase [Janthinobacterium sp. PC23-8]|uniref:chorismate--pyruvate lyase family protein n=1 Tax=Janthinobacterium sp. PC23-8 TaxID=2012679 RepID=UPI000B96C502|nr:chorismate lyase [Janthinobacterium sp. PC23-8]OYO30854.1 chorismate--pyruvate lyase [Janthinobacterium sp. PC23-8]